MQQKMFNNYQRILSSQYNCFKKCFNKYFNKCNKRDSILFCVNCRGGGGAVIKCFRGKIVGNFAQILQNDPLLQLGTEEI